jgi:hypothetical protein
MLLQTSVFITTASRESVGSRQAGFQISKATRCFCVPGLPTHLIMQYQENFLSGYIKSKV